MKKLYIDVSALCRPFDDQNVMRLRIESDAMLLIAENIRGKVYELIVSDVHFEEISGIKDYKERLEILTFLSTYGKQAKFDKHLALARTKDLRLLKFGISDAAHMAIAEKTSDIFITTDDSLLKKSKRNSTIISMNPIEFCNEENLQ